jgi:outer membrane biosynthesis protein TonB
MKNFILLIVLTLTVLGNVFGQKEKTIKQPIVNGMATYLPKHDFPQEAKDFCANGKVEVEVLIGEDGNVIEAKAISGDELLHGSAVEAAKKAKFTTGHLVQTKRKN